METPTYADVLGVAAMLAFIVRLVPQPLRLLRTGVPAGVSALTAMNIALTELAWLVYGLSVGLVPIWLVALLALPISMATVILLRHRISRNDLALVGLYTAVIVTSALVGHLGAVLALSVVVNYWPQVWTALRGRDLRGLAPASWWLALIDAALWGAYGLAVADGALLGYAVVLSTAATVILVRIAQVGPKTAEAAGA